MVGVYDEAICLLRVLYYEIAALHKVTLAMTMRVLCNKIVSLSAVERFVI